MKRRCCFLDPVTSKRCENTGEPDEGYDFYSCDGCLEKLERIMEETYFKKQMRHLNN